MEPDADVCRVAANVRFEAVELALHSYIYKTAEQFADVLPLPPGAKVVIELLDGDDDA